MKSPWLTVWQLVDYLHASRDKIYKLCQRGKIPAYKVQGQWLFDPQEVDAWVRTKRKKLRMVGRKKKKHDEK